MADAPEIEVKMKLDAGAASRLRSALEFEVGPPARDVLVCDAYYDRPDGALQASDRGLRIRSSRRVSDASKAPHVRLTVKGPRAQGPVKVRREIEFDLPDQATAEAFLDELGFVPRLTIEKRRRSWDFAGCRVEWDIVAELGEYVEVEGPSSQAVLEVRRRLGLADLPLIQESFAHLAAAHLVRRGPGEPALRFAAGPSA